MKKIYALIFLSFLSLAVISGNVERTFHITNCSVATVGQYQTVNIDNARQSGIPGEPSLPYIAVSLMLPPGESAASIEIIRENEVILTGAYKLYPNQNVLPISKSASRQFIKNEAVYQLNGNYPSSVYGHLQTQYLNGFAFGFSTFTPVNYNPATGKVSYFKDVTVRITTRPDAKSTIALQNLSSSKDVLDRVRSLVQNPEMMNQYTLPEQKHAGYQILIITPFAFEDGFTELVNFYTSAGMTCQITSVEDIVSGTSGVDEPEKIRNYIRQEYQNSSIEYVLLGGTEQWIPTRRFYDIVYSSPGVMEEESNDIPADLYYSALDGTDDLNGNLIYGEIADSTDLLPEVAIGRFPFTTAADLASMVHKSVSYQANPVVGEDNRPLLAGEYLYDTPVTIGGTYMDLLVDNHNDNGYSTMGIPSSLNNIDKLYDTLTPPSGYWSWTVDTLIAKINRGTSFIHHLGHANAYYMLRMDVSLITDAIFYGANGIDHNYSLIYTQGCDDGSYDVAGNIASQSLSINNFVVAGIFNTRYGWFDQGTSDGPSEHLQREFVSALFNDTQPENHIGKDQMISKIKTAPWVDLPGEFEAGAQRWTQYDCTLLGDPALWIRTKGVISGIPVKTSTFTFSLFPNPAHTSVDVSFSLPASANVSLEIIDAMGKQVGSKHIWSSETSGNHQYAVDLSGLSAGIYYCRLQTQTSTQTKKLVVIR